jgi:cell division protein FtsL
MEDQQLFNMIITASGALGGWMLKVIWDAISDLKKDVKDLNQEIHTDFLRKDDYRSDINDIKKMLAKIFDKLEQKADK